MYDIMNTNDTKGRSNMEIKDRIKQLRQEHDITMDLLAFDMSTKYKININKGLISKWESGKNDPSLRHAAYLADYFGVSLDYLIGLTDVRTPARLLAYARGIDKKEGDKK